MKNRLIKGLLLLVSLVLAIVLLPAANARADDSNDALVSSEISFKPSDKDGITFTDSVSMSAAFRNAITTYADFLDYYKVHANMDLYTLYFILINHSNQLDTPTEACAELSTVTSNPVDEKMLLDLMEITLPLQGYSIDETALQDNLKAHTTAQPRNDGYALKSTDSNTDGIVVPLIPNTAHTTITYHQPDGSTTTRTVSGNATQSPVTITSPVKSGYIADPQEVQVSFDQPETTVDVTYTKKSSPSIPTIDQTSLTADPTATITAGQDVTAETFNAKATDTTGQAIPVTLDTGQADLTQPGVYPMTLSAANGKQLTVTLTVKAATTPAKVYLLQTLYLYSQPTFKKSQRIAKYPKTKRTQRPIFTVTGQAYSSAGRLRYAVRDVNHGSATYGKTGYITAKASFVTAAYYQKAVGQVKVINAKGINTYHNQALTQKVTHVARGKFLKVTGIAHYRQTTRLQLANGQYITGNKTSVMAVGK